MAKHEILAQVKRAIREPYAWPGGYPVYTVMEDGELLCPKCARENFKQIARDTAAAWRGSWGAIGAEVHCENFDSELPDLCGHCGDELQSAY